MSFRFFDALNQLKSNNLSTPLATLFMFLIPLSGLLPGSSNLQFITPEPYTIGLMEASQAAASILPLYHPRQLNELLNSGKIRRVKAILAHLLR